MRKLKVGMRVALTKQSDGMFPKLKSKTGVVIKVDPADFVKVHRDGLKTADKGWWHPSFWKPIEPFIPDFQDFSNH